MIDIETVRKNEIDLRIYPSVNGGWVMSCLIDGQRHTAVSSDSSFFIFRKLYFANKNYCKGNEACYLWLGHIDSYVIWCHEFSLFYIKECIAFNDSPKHIKKNQITFHDLAIMAKCQSDYVYIKRHELTLVDMGYHTLIVNDEKVKAFIEGYAKRNKK